jgi:hypothetical protein
MTVAGAPTIAVEPREERGPRTIRRFGRRGYEPVSFPELVWVHHLRQKELKDERIDPYSGPCEQRYRRMEAAFEARYGEIVNTYWCSTEASGVALTLRPRPGMLPDLVRLHWATDWTTRAAPGLTNILYRCETLAVEIGEVLRDTSKRVAMSRLFNSVSYVLAFAESPSVTDKEAVQRVVEAQTAELDDLERYYRGAAGRSGQIVYLSGALLGVLPFLVLALVAALFGAFDAGREAIRTGAICFTAGALGALVSVMSRMNTNKVNVDWEFGKDTLRTLGSLRPFVGGIFGLMTYFGLESGLVSLKIGDGGGNGTNNFYFYVFSFAAGFSERLAQDMLLASTMGAGGKKSDEPPPVEPPPVTATGQMSGEAPAGPQPAA